LLNTGLQKAKVLLRLECRQSAFNRLAIQISINNVLALGEANEIIETAG
jgi:hypothetical protein